ncbi:hypothetical protein ACOME3_004085 [Neoechinorhynchus agilis]
MDCTFVQISDAEKIYILTGIQDDVRNDGRRCLGRRRLTIRTNFDERYTGSAKVKIGPTCAVAQASLSTCKPTIGNPDRGFIHLNVTCSPNACRNFEGCQASMELLTRLTSTLRFMLRYFIRLVK